MSTAAVDAVPSHADRSAAHIEPIHSGEQASVQVVPPQVAEGVYIRCPMCLTSFSAEDPALTNGEVSCPRCSRTFAFDKALPPKRAAGMSEELQAQVRFTGVGYFLCFVTIIITFAVALLLSPWIDRQLGWSSYPIALFLIPVLGAAVGFAVLAITVCDKLGIEVFVEKEADQQGASGDAGHPE